MTSRALAAALVGTAVATAGAEACAETPTLLPLSAYLDRNGNLDVEVFTCAQLTSMYQDDADFLAAWYTGWYSDLGRAHMGHITRARVGENEIIMYCRGHLDLRVVEAITAIARGDQ